MRVITGIARGMRLDTLPGDAVRPTADKVKEALFSILQFELEGRRMLDLFAGCGQLGIEALSRGAGQAVFVDASRNSAEIVRRNLQRTKLEKNARVVVSDSIAFLKGSHELFDIALLDPPYRKGLLEQALPLLERVMKPTGVIVCEHPEDVELPETAGTFVRTRSYRYGRIHLTLYRIPQTEE
jgi:16S rRNA (guanine(966)-N(2))-methyltransferase RsmD